MGNAPPGYNRVPVPDELKSWQTPHPSYRPTNFTDPTVRANDVTKNPKGWADEGNPRMTFARRGKPERLTGEAIAYNDKGYPLNPAGRTGTEGRGLLGKWGPNFAADPIVTRVNPRTGNLEMLAIRRKDNGQWAIPGGMVDPGEAVTATLAREFHEEAGVKLDMSDAKLIYEGMVDDRRNTDNAWMETTVKLKHLDAQTAAKMEPKAGDDANAVRWLELTPKNLDALYANHGEFVRAAMRHLQHGANAWEE